MTYKYHHTASGRGYISRKKKEGIKEPYKGKYGNGYIIRKPRYDTTRYHYIEYYTEE